MLVEGRPVPLLAVNHVLLLMDVVPLVVPDALQADLLVLAQHVLRLQLLGAPYLHALDDHVVPAVGLGDAGLVGSE